MDRSYKFILTLSALISTTFIALTLLNVEELGPYIGLYALSYLILYRTIYPRARRNYLGLALFLLFLIIATLEVIGLVGVPVPKI